MPASDEDHDDEVRAVVAADLPDAEVREVTPVEDGENSVYRIVLSAEEDRRGLFLKVGDHHFAAGCRAEPHLLDAVAERTEIPVPTVRATGHLDGDPYFLADAVPGLNLHSGPEGLAPEVFERVCADGGRYLGDLHAAFPADGWGTLGVERGADDLGYVREFSDWPTYFEAWLNHNVERLEDTRFADLRRELESHARILADELLEYGPFDPVLTHGDYRLGNLLVDPETGATNAVIDWATPTAVPAVHDLAVTEAILLDWPEVGEDRQRHLRERFYDAYRSVNPDVLDRQGFETHRRCCRFGARLRLMVNLDEEMAGRGQTAVDARAREHREALRTYGVG
ncbi:phosphotransferase family protein [Halorussus salinisoli]|uniref:phosphotransferase family protein n=1 Tax=Halorussus salinisoli TaxID=2558242 RepID=UPI0014851DF9|nr:aminoglycoside phosphotransferase family protein [Halorussus salinisoli]